MNPTSRPSPTRLALLAGLADLVATRQQAHPVRVAVDGVEAAGKTTLAAKLGALLAARGRPVIRAGIDGVGRPRADRYRRGELSAEGYWLDAFDDPHRPASPGAVAARPTRRRAGRRRRVPATATAERRLGPTDPP